MQKGGSSLTVPYLQGKGGNYPRTKQSMIENNTNGMI